MANYYRTLLLLSVVLMSSACNKSTQDIFRQTEEIKKYGLVFRLQDEKRRMDYYEKQGLAELAQTEKAKVERDNRNVVQSFQQEFDFSPIRFYYASQQDELLAGKPVLLNGELQPDASIPLPERVIVATFAPGEVRDNTHRWKAFRVGSTIDIRPTYKTWWRDRPLQPADVRRINRMLRKMNAPTAGVAD